MLIHLIPRMYACRTNEPCALIDVTCAELGLVLNGDKDLAARRPYPNKNYLVACRKVGQKAMQGILIEAPQFVRDFTVVTRWAVADKHIATHRVRYLVLDDDYDTVSENMMLWSAIHGDSRWAARYPDDYKGFSHVDVQPSMRVRPRVQKKNDAADILDEQGFIRERSETFLMHTIERERLHQHYCSVNEHTPSIEAAFSATDQSTDDQNINANALSRVFYFCPDEAAQYPHMTEVEILLGGVARVIYPDGTEQFQDDDKEPWNVYSPRLQREELERFCEKHLAHYQVFNREHEQQLIRCERVPMTPFWEN